MLKEILEYNLFEVGSYRLYVYQVAGALLVFVVLRVALAVIRFSVYKAPRIDIARKYAVYQIMRYFLIVLALVLALGALGVHVSVLLAGSAALLVGIGLGLQNLFNDFVSGIILLADGSVKVGDVIEVDGLVARVEQIHIRTTNVLTRDDKYIILPNSKLTSHQLINWTHNGAAARFEVSVGVEYGSDIDKVMDIMQRAAAAHPLVMAEPKPFVRLVEFGSSAIEFTVLFWTEEVFRVENTRSEIRIEISRAFSREGIVIPLPQRVIHTRPQG